MAEQLTPRQHGRQVEDVRGSGIYPATGPLPPGDAVVRTPGALGHPEERRVLQSSAGSVRTAAFLAGRAIFGWLLRLQRRQPLDQPADARGICPQQGCDGA